MRGRALVAAIASIVVTTVCAVPASAETPPEWTACLGQKKATPDQQITGCSVIILLGGQTDRDLAIAYLNRGYAYRRKNWLSPLDDNIIAELTRP